MTATRETQLDDLSAAKEAALDAWTQDGAAFGWMVFGMQAEYDAAKLILYFKLN